MIRLAPVQRLWRTLPAAAIALCASACDDAPHAVFPKGSPTVDACNAAAPYVAPGPDDDASDLLVRLEIRTNPAYQTIAACILLDGARLFVDRDTTGARFASGKTLAWRVRVAEGGEHTLSADLWTMGAGPFEGYQVRVKSQHAFVFENADDNAVAIAAVEKEGEARPELRLSVAWSDEGAVRAVPRVAPR